MTQDPHTRQEGGGAERADLRRGLRGGGLKLPGLKRWWRWYGLTQTELADRVDVPVHYVQRVEQGKRGCNRSVAHKMADLLEVDLQVLLGGADEEDLAAAAEETRPDSSPVGNLPPRG